MAKGTLAVLAVGQKEKGGMSEKDDAAQDLLDAIEAKDAKAASLALARHYELCASKAEAEEEY